MWVVSLQVECPYCGKKFSKLAPTHLKTHGKTKWDVKAEFPEIPMHAMEACMNLKHRPVDQAAIEYGNYRESRVRQHGGISKVKSREV